MIPMMRGHWDGCVIEIVDCTIVHHFYSFNKFSKVSFAGYIQVKPGFPVFPIKLEKELACGDILDMHRAAYGEPGWKITNGISCQRSKVNNQVFRSINKETMVKVVKNFYIFRYNRSFLKIEKEFSRGYIGSLVFPSERLFPSEILFEFEVFFGLCFSVIHQSGL